MQKGAFSSYNEATIFAFHPSAKSKLRKTASPQDNLKRRLEEAEKKHISRKQNVLKASTTSSNSIAITKSAPSTPRKTSSSTPRSTKHQKIEQELFLKQKLKQELLRKQQIDQALIKATNTLISKQQRELNQLKKKGVATMTQLQEIIERDNHTSSSHSNSDQNTTQPLAEQENSIMRRNAMRGATEASTSVPTTSMTTTAVPFQTTTSLPILTVRPSFGAAVTSDNASDNDIEDDASQHTATLHTEPENSMEYQSSDERMSRRSTPELPQEEFFSYPDEESFCVHNINSSGNNGSRLTSLFQSI